MYDDDSIKPLIDQFPRLFHDKPPEVASSVPRGWVPLVTRLLQDIDAMLDDEQAKRFHVLQVKEKFASLSVYWKLAGQTTTVIDVTSPVGVERVRIKPRNTSELFEQVSARVRVAEGDSRSICQRCGAEGTKAGGRGWLVTLCAPCRALQAEES